MNKHLTAVVIEDDPDINDLLTLVLRQAGFAVHTAMTGTEGVRAVREHLPDLVTTDLHLPYVDGIEVTRQIRTFSDAYILIISASYNQHDVLLGLQAGADDYITKPFRPRILRAKVEALQRRPQKKGAQDSPTSGGSPERDVLERNTRTPAVHVDGRQTNLTPPDFNANRCLASGGGVCLEDPSSAGWVSVTDDKPVEVRIRSMRSKLGEQFRGAKWFTTARCVGYRIAASA